MRLTAHTGDAQQGGGSPQGQGLRHFDLNIDKILENWELAHAVRELIANAIDESLLSGTAKPRIEKDEYGRWHVRDFGRGLQYENLLQSENPEKLESPEAIGKFGIGLKDALATFERKGIRVSIKSRHGNISLARLSKHSFEELVTLHASVGPSDSPSMQGTDCVLQGLPDSDMLEAQHMFLQFRSSEPTEKTNYGEVYSTAPGEPGNVYINGLKVAEEPDFLFSYNITSINSSIKRALNRERQNLSRSAYSDRVKAVLLACDGEAVAGALADNLAKHSSGTACDELNWLDVQQHAVRVLNARRKVVFLSAQEIADRPQIVDSSRSDGFEVVAVPERLAGKLPGIRDISGEAVVGLGEYIRQDRESFSFEWVAPANLTAVEQQNWELRNWILSLVGGKPRAVQDVRISETMRQKPESRVEATGIWLQDKRWIVIKRSQLADPAGFAGALLHEALHAKYGVLDVSREFELSLTQLVGLLVEQLIAAKTDGKQASKADEPRKAPAKKKAPSVQQRPADHRTWDELLKGVSEAKQNGRRREARLLAEKAVGAAEKACATDSLETAHCLVEFGDLQSDMIDWKPAEKALRKALSIREKELGRSHVDTADVLSKLGKLYAKKKQEPVAAPYHQAALGIYRMTLDNQDPRFLEELLACAEIALLNEDWNEAQRLAEEAMGIEKVGKELGSTSGKAERMLRYLEAGGKINRGGGS